MRKTHSLIVSSLLLASGFVFAQSFDDLGGFQSPSGNIFCVAYHEKPANRTFLRCDLKENTAKIPAKPKDCDLDWGNAFEVPDRGRAQRMCYGDTVQNPNYPMLGHGKKWRVQGIACDLSTLRLRCVNLDKHGFELAKGAQKVF